MLRGSLDGISPAEADRCFSLRDHFRRGDPHPRPPARPARGAQRRASGLAKRKRELREAEFTSELIRANARKLRKLVARLDWQPGRLGLERLPRREHLHRRDRASARRRSSARRSRAARPASSGTSAPTTAPTRGSRPTPAPTCSRSTPTTPPSTRSTARSQPRGTNRSCRWSPTSPTPRPASAGAASSAAPLDDRGRPDLVLASRSSTTLAIAGNVPLARGRRLAALARRARWWCEFPPRDDEMVKRLLSGKGAGCEPRLRPGELRRGCWPNASGSSAASRWPTAAVCSTSRSPALGAREARRRGAPTRAAADSRPPASDTPRGSRWNGSTSSAGVSTSAYLRNGNAQTSADADLRAHQERVRGEHALEPRRQARAPSRAARAIRSPVRARRPARSASIAFGGPFQTSLNQSTKIADHRPRGGVLGIERGFRRERARAARRSASSRRPPRRRSPRPAPAPAR